MSTDEPVRSINQYMDELEQDPRILSCSWHVGYIRHDTDVAGCGIVVVPATESDSAYAETIADQLAEYVWQKRHEFHYTGLTAGLEEALDMAVNFEGKPVFISDSGEYVTSGVTGWAHVGITPCIGAEDADKIISVCGNLRSRSIWEA